MSPTRKRMLKSEQFFTKILDNILLNVKRHQEINFGCLFKMFNILNEQFTTHCSRFTIYASVSFASIAALISFTIASTSKP